jgi:hypothetical protein
VNESLRIVWCSLRAVSEQASLNKTGTDIFVNFSSKFK